MRLLEYACSTVYADGSEKNQKPKNPNLIEISKVRA